MTVALIDNGSLVPAATRNLRGVATELSVIIETTVHAVSWKHSDRIPLAALDGDSPGTTLVPFVRSQLALGERHFVFAPFFISAQGAIGSALRSDLEKLQQEHAETPFAFTFTPGLADAGVIAQIVAARVRETISVASLDPPPVLVVDHGGPVGILLQAGDVFGNGSVKQRDPLRQIANVTAQLVRIVLVKCRPIQPHLAASGLPRANQRACQT